MFDKTNKITTSVEKSKKKSAPELTIAGMQDYAAVCAAITGLTAMKTMYESMVKGAANDYFIAEGMKIDRRPENIEAIEGAAAGSVQLKTKASNIALNPAEIFLLNVHKVPVRTETHTIGAWVLNPEVAENEERMAQIAEALQSVEGAEDLFKWQDSKEITICDGDKTINAIFALENEEDVRALLPLVSTLAIRPTLTATDEAAIEMVNKLVVAGEAKKAKTFVENLDPKKKKTPVAA